MLRSVRPARLALAVALLSLTSLRAGAQPLDQSQESFDNSHAISAVTSAWQVFKPSVTGTLVEIELLLSRFCVLGPCAVNSADLTVAIVETSANVPTSTVLGSVTVPGSGTQAADWLKVSLASEGIHVESGTPYAIHLSSTASGAPMDLLWSWAFSSSDVYAGTDFFDDIDNSDGLDDPTTANFPNADATFRTFVTPTACGDGVESAGEECDDGNTVDGDGCSAACLDEVCGDGALNGEEHCDDGNAADGDGCSASCTLEPVALACQQAIAKGGYRIAAARLAALQKCRNALAAGKELSVATAAECASETAAAKRIAKAAGQAREGIAEGNRPKCTDTLVAVLGACADTVDGLIGADAASGCLLGTHDAAVDAMLDAEYGY